MKYARTIALGLSVAITSTAAALAQSAGSALPAQANPAVPGATGETIVKGDHSTIAGTRDATLNQRYFQQSVGQEADRSDQAAASSTASVAAKHR